jgi:hypothetical protein
MWTEHTQPARVSVAQPAPPPSPPKPANPPPLPQHAVPNNPELHALRAEYDELNARVLQLRELEMLQEIGIYQFRHRLADAPAYKERLAQTQRRIKEIAKADGAVSRGAGWAINGSAAEGAKMVNDLSKLMLRAYNAEADDAVRTLKPYALETAIERLEKSRAAISKLGASLKIEVTGGYHAVRVEELELTADYLVKLDEEKERERAERERAREDQKAQRELEREEERLEKERGHYATVLAALRVKGDFEAVKKAEAQIEEIDAAIDGVKERAANTRAGYVYVISNFGAFGDRVVKIGLTRRLDPLERVRELGDASVPFRFDVHAMVFSTDAVALETKLHHHFAKQRVNMINARREFFIATPQEVRDALLGFEANLLSFNEVPEALEWRQSLTARQPNEDVSKGGI